MPSPFDSAHRKVAWADKCFDDLDREVKTFLTENPYKEVVEADPDVPEHFLHKIKLTKSLDETPIAEIIGDILSNLRASLDHAIYAVASARHPNPRYAYFPFSDGATGFENSLKGNCKHVQPEMFPLLRSFQPYQRGNENLYALHALRNTDSHAMITPAVTNFLRPYTSVRARGYAEMILPEYSRWDRTKQEVVFLRTRLGTEVDYQIEFHFFIAFYSPLVVQGYPVLEVLQAIGCEVNATISAIEAESRRLKIVK